MGDSDKLTRYQKQQKGKQGQSSVRLQGQLEKKIGGTRERTDRTQQRLEGDKIDSLFGFDRMKEGMPRVGWLLNYLPITMPDESGIEKSGLDLYFIERGGSSSIGQNFKATVFFEPYFYIDVSDPRRLMEISTHLLKRFEGCKIMSVDREDLDLPNHLSGKKHPFLKISFGTTGELMDAKNILRPIVHANQKRIAGSGDYYGTVGSSSATGHDIWEDGSSGTVGALTAADAVSNRSGNITRNIGSVGGAGNQLSAAPVAAQADPLAYILELREYDVPYGVRVSIDLDLRVGAWYTVTPEYGCEVCQVALQRDLLELCEPRILAFDIECEKSPLKFPNADVDRIFMISYMIKDQGFLIINREIVSEDIDDFEYTPKPSYPGPFHVMNEANEEALLRKFLTHVQELRPHVIVTYNGDKFDWPYVEARCRKYSYLSVYSYLGIKSTVNPTITAAANNKGDEASTSPPSSSTSSVFSDNEYTGRCVVHLDAFCWVQRDSYLPQGNQGLKAVTKYKLGYDPVEVDPEDMLRFARERPHHMASYSVSDAVATYYLYTTYVHNFIFSLSTIIPLAGEDVLRKGSGTLCEVLLMVEAYRYNIICPNKQIDPLESFHEGRLMESETYIGGHVECLEAGVFRADIPTKFQLVPAALQQLIDHIDRDLTFTLEVEHGMQRSDVINYDEVRQSIVQKLEALRDSPLREEAPIIYHLDVGAMYPNIILTNRLQPSAMVSTSDCAACTFNRAENQCKRPMGWTWRGEYSPASYAEYQSVRRQLTYEKVATNITSTSSNNNSSNSAQKTFSELSERDQAAMVRARLKAYTHRVYRKTKVTSIEQRVDTVCMRENSFYVDTVKAFRDRRYDYKLLTKEWKNKKISADKAGDVVSRKSAEDMEVLMDSLQLAHKCILNSFYGYVMRKGARWRSMEMAGIVTYTGAQLIRQARELVEQVGRPLELDTDGIWCILPISFPQDFKFKLRDGKGSVSVGYPCAMLNADVHERYTNHQYQELQKTTSNSGSSGGTIPRYATHSECSIFFELDGPYKAMVLPASPEEGKLLKKKYVVFNFNGTIAELKGFELKRRGELELVKIFQSEVFQHFLAGQSLDECYRAVGAIANQWLDVLDERGASMADDELLELISERKTISKTVDDYEGRKSTSLTTAARLADFLGADMVKDKGLNCNLIISRLPAGAPVTERAIPVAIFSCEPAIRKYFLRKWLKDSTLDCEDFRDVVDWTYYKDRLGKTIQKIITIPAGIQKITNPCPRIEHPLWLQRDILERSSGRKQLTILNSFRMMRNLATAAAASHSSVLPGLVSIGSTNSSSSSFLMLGGDTVDNTECNNHATVSTKKRVRIQLAIEEEETVSSSITAEQKDDEVDDSNDLSEAVTNEIADDIEEIVGGNNDVSTAVPFKKHSNNSTDTRSRPNTDLSSEVQSCDENTDTASPTNTGKEKVLQITPLNELPEGRHQSAEEFFDWLADRKSRWKLLRMERRQRSQQQRQLMQQYNSNNISTTMQSAIFPGSKRNIGVADFVRNASLAASRGFWQVLELQETDTPGEFIVWAMTAPTQLQKLNIVIQRQLYVNVQHAGREAQTAALQLGGVLVRKDLPHGKYCRALYEINIPERKYVRNERALNTFLCDTQVEGVYESQVPLWLRGVLTMGCVATVNSQRYNNSNNNSYNSSSSGSSRKYFRLEDLDLVHVQSHPYLAPHTAVFKRIFLYFAADRTHSSGDIGVIGLFQLESSNVEHLEECQRILRAQLHSQAAAATSSGEVILDINTIQLLMPPCLVGKAYVWLISGRGGGLLDSKLPLQRIYRKFLQQQQQQHLPAGSLTPSLAAALGTESYRATTNAFTAGAGGAEIQQQLKFVQSFVPSVAAGWQQCNERLTLYQREMHGPTVVIVQGSSNSSSSSSTIGGNMNTSSAGGIGMDCKQWRHILPALHDFPLAVMPPNTLDNYYPAVGWQMFAAERMMQRYLIFPRWFDDRLNCSRYSCIPICNLGNDALTTMMDVLFARQLTHNRHLLWASDSGSGAPDLGKGADSNSQLDLLDIWSENLEEPIVNVPGVYRNVCVELDLFGLAVCAIMSSGELDAEGLTAVTMTSTAAATVASSSVPAGGKRSSSSNSEDNEFHHDSDNEREEHHSTASLSSGYHHEGAVDEAATTVLTEGSDSFSDASCARAFNIFKALVAKCIEETKYTDASSSRGLGLADSILTSVYRYLCGFGNGMLSDPLLHKVIYGLMTKLFQKLLGGLRKLGTKIVYADFGRIIISTNKHDYDAATEYVEFILAAIGNKSTFAFLQVNVATYWQQMCWLDPQNWGALPLSATTATISTTSVGDDNNNNDDDDVVYVNKIPTAEAASFNSSDDDEDDEAEKTTLDQSDDNETSTNRNSNNTSNTVEGKNRIFLQNNKNSGTTSRNNGDDSLDFLNKNINKRNNDFESDDIAAIKRRYGKNTTTQIDRTDSVKSKKRGGAAKRKHQPHMKTTSGSILNGSIYDDQGNSDDDNSDDDNDDDDDHYFNYSEDDSIDNNNNETGIASTNDFEEEEDEEDSGTSSSSQLAAHWNLATYLPPAAAEYFKFIIAEFLGQHKAKREQLVSLRDRKQNEEFGDDNIISSEEVQVTSSSSDSSLLLLVDDDSIDNTVAEYMRQLIQQRLTTKMLEIVDELNLAALTHQYSNHGYHNSNNNQQQHQSSAATSAASMFPVRAGSHLHMTNPALEFVKATTHIMGLDPLLTSEVAALRRLLLTQLHVREFNEDSVFRDPCLSYTLRDVICSYCSTCRDVDLLRDEGITCDNFTERWKCSHCGNRINTDEIENRLLEAVDKLCASYLLQDMRCRSTHRVTRRLGTAVSDLCDPLVMDITRPDALQQLQILRQVAIFHGFVYLREAVDELN